MKLSPLQLKRYVVPEVVCTASAAYDQTKPIGLNENSFKAESRIRLADEQPEAGSSEWVVELSVAQEPDDASNVSYAFRIHLVGVFVYASTPTNVPAEVFVKTNGSSMLYGIAREMLRSITVAGPWGGLLIPAVSFYAEPPPATVASEVPEPHSTE